MIIVKAFGTEVKSHKFCAEADDDEDENTPLTKETGKKKIWLMILHII